MRRVTVEVTAEDIAKGAPTECEHCPIALAVKRATGESFASVTPHRIRLERGEGVPPQVAIDFMRAFDDGTTVEPFTFKVELP